MSGSPVDTIEAIIPVSAMPALEEKVVEALHRTRDDRPRRHADPDTLERAYDQAKERIGSWPAPQWPRLVTASPYYDALNKHAVDDVRFTSLPYAATSVNRGSEAGRIVWNDEALARDDDDIVVPLLHELVHHRQALERDRHPSVHQDPLLSEIQAYGASTREGTGFDRVLDRYAEQVLVQGFHALSSYYRHPVCRPLRRDSVVVEESLWAAAQMMDRLGELARAWQNGTKPRYHDYSVLRLEDHLELNTNGIALLSVLHLQDDPHAFSSASLERYTEPIGAGRSNPGLIGTRLA